jgi:hypothetical protein
MWWILTIGLQVAIIASGIRQEERAGLWSWSKFFFALAFGGLEWCVLWIPMRYVDMHSRWFGWAVAAGALIALGNFVWFIIVCRRWKLPDGRTSLEAYYDEHPKK